MNIQDLINDIMAFVQDGHDFATHINDDACYVGIVCQNNTRRAITVAVNSMDHEQLVNLENDIDELVEELAFG